MQFLKQSTGVTVIIGPYLKTATGGTVPITNWALTSGVSIIKASATPTMTARNGNDKIDHIGRGYYTCQLDATDTGTVGMLSIVSATSVALPVWHDYMVQGANAWDTMFGSDKWNVEVDKLTNSGASINTILLGNIATGATCVSILADTAQTGASVTLILEDTSTTLQNEIDGIEATVERSGTSITAILVDTAAMSTSGVSLLPTGVSKIWDRDVDTHHQTAGSAGKKLDAAGAAADPWSTALPGAYGVGTAGKIIGQTGASVNATLVDTAAMTTTGVSLLPTGVSKIWDRDVDSHHQTAGSAGKKLDEAGSAGDPWGTAVPGAYGVGTAGKIIGQTGASIDAILTDTADLQGAQGDWATATGFATATKQTKAGVSLVTILADTDDLQGNQAAWATATGFATAAKQTKAGVSLVAVLADTDDLQGNQSAWATATGFATATKQTKAGVSLVTILADTNELQGDDIPGTLATILADTNQTGASVTLILEDTSTTLQNELDGIEATVERSGTSITNILVDTNDLQTSQGDWDSGATYAQIQSACSAALHAGRGEPVAGAPGVSENPLKKLDYLYKAWRNKIDSGATTLYLYNDDQSTKAQKSTHSDSGTTYTRTEWGSA